MSTAGANGAALDAAAETGPAADNTSSPLAEALAEVAAAEARVAKVAANLAGVKESLKAARARAAQLRGKE